MAPGIFPIFDKIIDEAIFKIDGKVLLREHQKLDEISVYLGLPRFSSFGDNREIPEGFDGTPDEFEEMIPPFNEWFDVEKGLETVNLIIYGINNNIEIRQKFKIPDILLEELHELSKCLTKAMKYNAKFRLEIG